MNERLSRLLGEVFSMNQEELSMELTQETISNWDSLKQMDLIFSLEKEFQITLDVMDIVKMNSISKIVEVLSEKGCDVGT